MKAWLGMLWLRWLVWTHTHVLPPAPRAFHRVRRASAGTWRCVCFMDGFGEHTFQVYRGGSWFAEGSAPTPVLACRVARVSARRTMFDRGLRHRRVCDG